MKKFISGISCGIVDAGNTITSFNDLVDSFNLSIIGEAFKIDPMAKTITRCSTEGSRSFTVDVTGYTIDFEPFKF